MALFGIAHVSLASWSRDARAVQRRCVGGMRLLRGEGLLRVCQFTLPNRMYDRIVYKGFVYTASGANKMKSSLAEIKRYILHYTKLKLILKGK